MLGYLKSGRIRQSWKTLTKKFNQNEDGAFGIMFAVCLLMLVMSVGIAVDINRYHQKKAIAQIVADNIGLTAAVYIRDHDTPPSSSEHGYVGNHLYDINLLAPNTGVNDMSGHFKVNYNDTKKQAEVKVDAQINTAFMAAFNFETLNIEAESTVKYLSESAKPVSVFLIVDNSGSMAWDDKPISKSSSKRPVGAKTRIAGLKETATKFNADLGNNIDNKKDTHLRMALLPYSRSIKTDLKKDPAWSPLNPGSFARLVASGGTDSRPPLELANKWMEDENYIHFSKNKENNPGKYVIFMTDGANNEEYLCDWQNKKGTKFWRKLSSGTYTYKKRKKSPGTGWEEGYQYNCRYENVSNVESLKTCSDLKSKDVEIFTIGYALEPGTYYADYPALRQTTQISEHTAKSAYSFLEECASSEEHFIRAENTDALEDAFDKIGKKIHDDTIRIAN